MSWTTEKSRSAACFSPRSTRRQSELLDIDRADRTLLTKGTSSKPSRRRSPFRMRGVEHSTKRETAGYFHVTTKVELIVRPQHFLSIGAELRWDAVPSQRGRLVMLHASVL